MAAKSNNVEGFLSDIDGHWAGRENRGMENAKGREGSKGSGGVAVVVVVLMLMLPALYVLSIGPAAWLSESGYVGESVEEFYMPLFVVADNCQPVAGALQWYVEFWLPPNLGLPEPATMSSPTPAAS